MNNLIIAILAIAITAVAGLAGSYYGGNAFIQGQGKARANKIAAKFETVAGGLNLWSQRNGGIYPNAENDFPVSAASTDWFTSSELAGFLSPRYLNESIFSNFTILYYQPDTTYSGILIARDTDTTDMDAQACLALEAIRKGSPPTAQRNNSAAANGNQLFCGQVGCFYDDSAGPLGSFTGDYIAYYRVNGKQQPGNPDCS